MISPRFTQSVEAARCGVKFFFRFSYSAGPLSCAAVACPQSRAAFFLCRARDPKKFRTFALGKDKGVSCPGCDAGGAEMIPSDLMQAMLP